MSAEAAIDEGKAAEQRQRAQVAATDAAWTSAATAADEEGEEGSSRSRATSQQPQPQRWNFRRLARGGNGSGESCGGNFA